MVGIISSHWQLTVSSACCRCCFQLEADTTNCDPKKDPKCKPQLSQDQALCQYGQSGAARAEACKRVKAAGGALPSASPQGKSLGGAYAL